MSSSPINVAVDGTIISAAIVNQYFNALIGDIDPRNSNGDVTDLAGNLGSTLYRWLKVYTSELHLGTIPEDCYFKITGSDPNQIIEFYVGGVRKGRIDANGFNGNDIGDGSIGAVKLANKTIENTEIKDNTLIHSLFQSDCIEDNNILNREVTREKTSNVESAETNDASFSTSSTTPVLVATLTVALYDVSTELDGSSVPKPFIIGMTSLKTTGVSHIDYNSATFVGIIRLTKTVGAGAETTIANWQYNSVISIPPCLTYFDTDFTSGTSAATNIVYKFYAYVNDASTTLSYTNVKFYAYSLK